MSADMPEKLCSYCGNKATFKDLCAWHVIQAELFACMVPECHRYAPGPQPYCGVHTPWWVQ